MIEGGTAGRGVGGEVSEGGAGGVGEVIDELLAACLANQDVITFAAAELEAVVRAAINKPNGELRVQDSCRLTELWVEAPTLEDLSGIEQLEQLRNLTIVTSAVTDVTPLAGMTGLRKLAVVGQVSDISSLASLTELRTLNFNFNAADITDISVVANMSELVDLQLADNAVADLTPLTGLTKLVTLGLMQNPAVVDISPLAGLTLLEDLDLAGTGIDDADLQSLVALTQLTTLHVSATSISSLEVISTLTALTQLTVASTQINAADLGELDTLTQLVNLDVNDNALTTLSTIPHPARLEILNVSRNPLANHAELSAFTSVRRLFIDDTGAVDGDLVHLQELTELDYLQLGGNAITNLAPLTTLASLGNVGADDNPLSASSCCTHIPALEQAGVSVYVGNACAPHDCP